VLAAGTLASSPPNQHAQLSPVTLLLVVLAISDRAHHALANARLISAMRFVSRFIKCPLLDLLAANQPRVEQTPTTSTTPSHGPRASAAKLFSPKESLKSSPRRRSSCGVWFDDGSNGAFVAY
jgi:hypothetical protein